MTKSKLKIKKDKDALKDAYKIFSEASAFMIEGSLNDIDFGELVMGLYLPTKDEDIIYLMKTLEKYLLHAKLHPDEARAGLHKFCISVSDEIREKKWFGKFYKLVYLVYASLDEKNVNQKIVDAYFNLAIQLNTYLSNSPKLIPYGIRKNGELMVRNEVVNNLVNINIDLYHALKKDNSLKSIQKVYSKYGYKNISEYADFQKIMIFDQVISNMLFHMTYFIDEDNEHIVAPPFAHPNNMPSFHSILSNKTLVDMLQNRIRQREILLPAEGILVKIKGMTSIKEVFLEETIKDDNVILLYRLKMQDGHLSGFYDTRNEFFYMPWRDSSVQESVNTSLKSLILQMYLYLTCTLSESEKMELYLLDNVARGFQIEYCLKVANATSKHVTTYRHYDRTQYLAELINIKPFLRHLPVGAEASDDAIKLARRLGIDLPKGMTLVSGFKRKSWIKDKHREET